MSLAIEGYVEVEPEEEYFDVVLDIESTGLKPDLYRIIAIGVMVLPHSSDERRTRVFFADTPADEVEAELIRGVEPILREAQTVYTWKGSYFDVPFLLSRALRYRIFMPWLVEKHVDLFEVVKTFFVSNHPQAKAPSLDAMCKFLFNYDRRLNLRGPDVPELYERWQNGDREAKAMILEHLKEDLEMTAMVLDYIRPYVETYKCML